MVPITTEGPIPFQRYPWHLDRFSGFGDHREQTYIKNLKRFIYIDFGCDLLKEANISEMLGHHGEKREHFYLKFN